MSFCVVRVLSHPLAVLQNRSHFVISSGDLQRDTGSARLPRSLSGPFQLPLAPGGLLLASFRNNADLSGPRIYLCAVGGVRGGAPALPPSGFLGAKNATTAHTWTNRAPRPAANPTGAPRARGCGSPLPKKQSLHCPRVGETRRTGVEQKNCQRH